MCIYVGPGLKLGRRSSVNYIYLTGPELGLFDQCCTLLCLQEQIDLQHVCQGIRRMIVNEQQVCLTALGCLSLVRYPLRLSLSLSLSVSLSLSLSLSLTHSLTPSLTHSLTHPPTPSPTHPLTHSPTHSLTHSLTHSPTHPPTHSLTHSLTH